MDYIKINIIFSFLHQDSSFFSLFQVEKCVSRKENILTVKKEKATSIPKGWRIPQKNERTCCL